MKPMSTGYADVDGITLYREIYGQHEPVVLIPGGLTTIGEMQGWVQPLAMTRQVIAVELQGHGHTADTDRPLSFATMGDDIAALLDHLTIPQADVVGQSLGGALFRPTGGRNVCISALHVDVARRVHRGSERRTGQPRRRRFHAAA